MENENLKRLGIIELYVSLRKIETMATQKAINFLIWSAITDAYLHVASNMLGVKHKPMKSKVLIDSMEKSKRIPVSVYFKENKNVEVK